jgi:hypothetical protein
MRESPQTLCYSRLTAAICCLSLSSASAQNFSGRDRELRKSLAKPGAVGCEQVGPSVKLFAPLRRGRQPMRSPRTPPSTNSGDDSTRMAAPSLTGDDQPAGTYPEILREYALRIPRRLARVAAAAHGPAFHAILAARFRRAPPFDRAIRRARPVLESSRLILSKLAITPHPRPRRRVGSRNSSGSPNTRHPSRRPACGSSMAVRRMAAAW